MNKHQNSKKSQNFDKQKSEFWHKSQNLPKKSQDFKKKSLHFEEKSQNSTTKFKIQRKTKI